MSHNLDEKLFSARVFRVMEVSNLLFWDCETGWRVSGRTGHITLLRNHRPVYRVYLRPGLHDAKTEVCLASYLTWFTFEFFSFDISLLSLKWILRSIVWFGFYSFVSRECPNECREAIPTLMYAAARFADLPELRELRSLFTEKYGNSLDSYVIKEVSP